MVTEENAENMQDVISQHFMQRMDFANPAQWHIIRYGLFLAHTLKVAKILKFCRAAVRAGATGASAPAEIRQRVRRTRPQNLRTPFRG